MNGGEVKQKPLADFCALCGQGYCHTLEITIADEPDDGEYRWSHRQCKRDHSRVFLESFGEKNTHDDTSDNEQGGLD